LKPNWGQAQVFKYL